MFDVQIRLILEYAHKIWYNGKTTNEHEKIHLSNMKEKLKVKRSSCTNAIYAEFGRFPLIIKQKVKVLKYWQMLLSLPHEHVLKQSYNCLKKIHKSGQHKWCTYICELPSENEFQESWKSQSFENYTLGHISKKNYTVFIWKNVWKKSRTLTFYQN